MKINWGVGIAIFYASFMVILLYFVIKSTTHDNSLVYDNYYDYDLKYQSHYDKVVNTQNLAQQVTIDLNETDKTIEIRFPEDIKNIAGTIQLFRPSTKHRDIFKPIKVDENGRMTVATDQLKAGRWKVKMDWTGNQTEYYSETDIVL